MQKKKGISLIVLVITIIVMVILAGAIILTLNNSGIIGKASEAVEKTDEATVKELAQLAWAEAYADGVRTVEDAADGTKGFKTRIEEALEKNKIDTEEYILHITTSGVTVKQSDKVWVQEGFTVKRGNQVMEIGDTVNYDAGVSTYTGGWKVLGADDDGNLLIMSTESVGSINIGGKSLEESQNEWLNGAVEKLDAACEPYGHGSSVVGKARSIRVEDIDKVTGYDKTTYGTGTLAEYGNIMQYSYNGSENPSYVGSSGLSGTLLAPHSAFYYYDGTNLKSVNDILTGKSGDTFATVTSNVYAYKGTDLTTISDTTNKKAFTMIFGEYSEEWEVYTASYWLASSYVAVNEGNVIFGVYDVAMGEVNSSFLLQGFMWNSTGGYDSIKGTAVRAVVTLSSDITFNGSSDTAWSY